MLARLLHILPNPVSAELRRMRYAWKIHQGSFVSPEPDFAHLSEYVREGNWVLDIGANVGHYTRALSRLVGAGRVVAFEPIPATFSMLSSNVADLNNVTLVNAAASEIMGEAHMSIPGHNPYQAAISKTGNLRILTLPVDSLPLPPITFVKIDVEGHELPALIGMRRLLERDHPTLVVEGCQQGVHDLLISLGYTSFLYENSPNTVWQWEERPTP